MLLCLTFPKEEIRNYWAVVHQFENIHIEEFDIEFVDHNSEYTKIIENRAMDEETERMIKYETWKRNNFDILLELLYNYCKENNIRFYPFFLRNPKWGNFDLVIPVEVDGDNKITVSKANIKYYILPGGIQMFDPINFFENQDLIISSIN